MVRSKGISELKMKQETDARMLSLNVMVDEAQAVGLKVMPHPGETDVM